MVAQDQIKDLESAVISAQFLQETYYFDPDLVDLAPYFTPEQEEFARSGFRRYAPSYKVPCIMVIGICSS